MKRQLLLTALSAVMVFSAASALTTGFKVSSINFQLPTADSFSFSYDVQYNCHYSPTGADCTSDKESANQIPSQDIPQILPLYNWADLDPKYTNVLQLGYYDAATKQNVFPANCKILVDGYPTATVAVTMDQNGCHFS